MTKKHFIELADWMRNEFPYNGTEEMMQESIADFCRSQNSRFLRERWLGYVRGECGPNGGTIKKTTIEAVS